MFRRNKKQKQPQAVIDGRGFSAGATPTKAPKRAVPPPGAVDLMGRKRKVDAS